MTSTMVRQNLPTGHGRASCITAFFCLLTADNCSSVIRRVCGSCDDDDVVKTVLRETWKEWAENGEQQQQELEFVDREHTIVRELVEEEEDMYKGRRVGRRVEAGVGHYLVLHLGDKRGLEVFQ